MKPSLQLVIVNKVIVKESISLSYPSQETALSWGPADQAATRPVRIVNLLIR